jgi:hypothetical protein
MRIGLVDIDTSHPENWIPFLREMGHEVVALWDGGGVHSPAYVKEFAATHKIPLVVGDLDNLPDQVDCAIIHSCDWDLHVRRAVPFIAAGKSVLIDKPLAGRVEDFRQLVRWAEEGHRIAGGSSLRFTAEVAEFLARPLEERGEVHTVFAGCGIDEFNYGIHAYGLLWSLMGAGARQVRFLGEAAQWLIEVRWEDNRRGILSVGRGPWLPLYATVVTTKGVSHLAPRTTPDPLYKGLLSKTLRYLAAESDVPALPMVELIEPELAAIAALTSRQRRGEPVSLDQIADAPGYDGNQFALEYRRQRGK